MNNNFQYFIIENFVNNDILVNTYCIIISEDYSFCQIGKSVSFQDKYIQSVENELALISAKNNKKLFFIDFLPLLTNYIKVKLSIEPLAKIIINLLNDNIINNFKYLNHSLIFNILVDYNKNEENVVFNSI